MQQFLRLGQDEIFGAPIYAHWSVFAAGGLFIACAWPNFLMAAISVIAFFAITVIHEIGHALVAHCYGYAVVAIRLSALHGTCEYEAPHYEWEDVLIAWGGVLAQAVAAIVVFFVGLLGARSVPYFAPIKKYLIYYSLFIIVFNLLPVKGFDGYKAWKIMPILRDRLNQRPLNR